MVSPNKPDADLSHFLRLLMINEVYAQADEVMDDKSNHPLNNPPEANATQINDFASFLTKKIDLEHIYIKKNKFFFETFH